MGALEHAERITAREAARMRSAGGEQQILLARPPLCVSIPRLGFD